MLHFILIKNKDCCNCKLFQLDIISPFQQIFLMLGFVLSYLGQQFNKLRSYNIQNKVYVLDRVPQIIGNDEINLLNRLDEASSYIIDRVLQIPLRYSQKFHEPLHGYFKLQNLKLDYHDKQRKFNYYKVKLLLHKQSGNQNSFSITKSSNEQSFSSKSSSNREQQIIKVFLDFLSSDFHLENQKSNQQKIDLQESNMYIIKFLDNFYLQINDSFLSKADKKQILLKSDNFLENSDFINKNSFKYNTKNKQINTNNNQQFIIKQNLSWKSYKGHIQKDEQSTASKSIGRSISKNKIGNVEFKKKNSSGQFNNIQSTFKVYSKNQFNDIQKLKQQNKKKPFNLNIKINSQENLLQTQSTKNLQQGAYKFEGGQLSVRNLQLVSKQSPKIIQFNQTKSKISQIYSQTFRNKKQVPIKFQSKPPIQKIKFKQKEFDSIQIKNDKFVTTQINQFQIKFNTDSTNKVQFLTERTNKNQIKFKPIQS